MPLQTCESLPSLWKDFTCPQPLVFSLQNPFAPAKLTFNKTLPEMRFIFTKCPVPCAIWGWPGAHLMWHNSWFQKHDFRPWLKPRLKQLVAQLGSDFFKMEIERNLNLPRKGRRSRPSEKGWFFIRKFVPQWSSRQSIGGGGTPGRVYPAFRKKRKGPYPPNWSTKICMVNV